MNSPSINKHKNVLVVIRPLTRGDLVGQTLLENLLILLKPLTNKIFIITSNYDKLSNEHLNFIHVNGKEKFGENFAIRILKYIIVELKVTYHLIMLKNEISIAVFFIGASSYIFPLLAAKLLNKKTMVIITGSPKQTMAMIHERRLRGMGSIFIPSIFSLLENLSLRLFDSIVVYSPMLVEKFKLSKYAHKIKTNGARFVNTDIFQFKDNIDEREILVGYIGRICEEKGVLNFVKAVPLVSNQASNVKIKFFIGGDGWQIPEIKSFIENNKISTVIRLKEEWISHEELPSYLAELKLLVLPSYTEGLPNIVLEAMACGTLTLSTPVGAVRDIIVDEKTGFIMEDNSPESIAKNILRALCVHNANEIALNARKLIEENFSYKSAVARYNDILSEYLL